MYHTIAYYMSCWYLQVASTLTQGSQWSLSWVQPPVTQQREHEALHKVQHSPLLQALLDPRKLQHKSRVLLEEKIKGTECWPVELCHSQIFSEMLLRRFDPTQCEAIVVRRNELTGGGPCTVSCGAPTTSHVHALQLLHPVGMPPLEGLAGHRPTPRAICTGAGPTGHWQNTHRAWHPQCVALDALQALPPTVAGPHHKHRVPACTAAVPAAQIGGERCYADL